jgi:hypothetical protein
MSYELEGKIFELVSYMITSACILGSEQKAYGPFRLLDATSRLIQLLQNGGWQSARLLAIQERIDSIKLKVIEPEGVFQQSLDELVFSLIPLMSTNDTTLDTPK